MQVAAEHSRFNGGADYRRETAMAAYDPSQGPPVAPVRGRFARPPSGASYYGADDPGAEGGYGMDAGAYGGPGRPPSGRSVGGSVDWAGEAERSSSRKHVTGLREDLGPGLDPRSESSTHNERKHYEKDIRFRSVDPAAQDQPLGVATYQFGPGGEHTASVWKTETQRLFDKEDTDKAAKSEKCSKRSITPMYASQGASASAESAIMAARMRHEGTAVPDHMKAFGMPTGGGRHGGAGGSGSLTGGGGRKVMGPNSLLAGIGSKIAVPPPSSSSSSSHNPAVKAAPMPGYTGHKPASGPLKDASASGAAETSAGVLDGTSSKALYVENYRSLPPGYTGRRGRPF